VSLSFERPFFVFLGIFAILGIIIFSRFFRRIFTLDVSLGPPGGTSFKPPLNLDILMKFLGVLDAMGFFCLFLAAGGPQLLSTETVWLNRGGDILFVVDISPSMAGLDMDGRSRFEAAHELVRDFALNRPSDAIGLVALGSDAALMVPPTIDRESLLDRLDSLRIAELGDGTALGMGLAIAALHLGRSRAPRRTAVLITDGENNAGAVHPETAAALFPELGISLWVISLGGGGEVAINYVDPRTRMRRTGTFDSRYDPESLRTIALKGGGTWLAAPSAESFRAAFSRLDTEEMTVHRSGVITRTNPVQGIFILSALILLVLPWFIRRFFLGGVL
jgi:Ca-activated chloride channel family protein